MHLLAHAQRILSTLALTLTLGACVMSGTHNSPQLVTTPAASLRGVNLGNALEAPNEGEWDVTLQEDYFQQIHDAGFSLVRIPVRWSAHAAEAAPYAVDSQFLARVDWAVEQAIARGMVAVVDIHHYDGLIRSPAGQRARFLALWRQLAAHYADYPDGLWLEVLNEPNGALGGRAWNALALEAIAAIRETNPTRTIVVGGGEWNSVTGLLNLKLPAEDRHIVATFHYYQPFAFTHQGAEWVDGSQRWLGTRWRGSASEQATLRGDLDAAAAWAQREGRPLLLGEFGAYRRADEDSRKRWTAFVAREAEVRGISWAYWEFCAGFGIYDPNTGVWREGLRDALIPPAAATP